MVIELKEVRELVREVWNKLYFNSYGAYRDGIDKMSQLLEEELDKFIEAEGKKIAEALDKPK